MEERKKEKNINFKRSINKIIRNISCVKSGDSYGEEELKTNIGAPQGDCPSPIIFLLYLSKATEEMKVNVQNQNFNEITYADDQNIYSSNKQTKENIQKIILKIYSKFNLKINLSKTISFETNNLRNTKTL